MLIVVTAAAGADPPAHARSGLTSSSAAVAVGYDVTAVKLCHRLRRRPAPAPTENPGLIVVNVKGSGQSRP